MNNKINNKRLAIHRSDGKQRKKKNNRQKLTQNKGSSGRWSIYSRAGQQALRDINYVRRFINTEIHYIDVAATSEVSSTTATFVLLNGVTLGDTAILRTGDSIKMDGCSIRYFMSIGGVASLSFERVMIVMDKQSNQAVFPIANLLNATTVVSPYVPESKDRFVVLHDKSYKLALNENFGEIDEANIGVQSHVDYALGANAGTVADILTNSLYLVHFSNQAVNTVTLTYYVRTWFIDN